jgi:SAM-dependent methyltransferase
MEAITYEIESQVGEKHWWFQARRAILKDQIERMQLPANPSIFDLGCGTGHNLVMLQELGDATGIDMSNEALAHCRALGVRKTLQGDLTALPLENGVADLVVASDILEHLDDDLAGAREIYRVLKPGGTALITVPAFRWLWGPQDDVSHHKRRYTRKELATLLASTGLVIDKLTYFNFFLLAPIWLGRTLLKLSRSKVVSENTLTPGALDGFLGGIFASEAHWLRFGGFPVGVSLIAIARKKETP